MFGFVPRSLAVVGIVGALSFGMPVAAQADTSVTVLKFLAKAATFGGIAGVGVKAAAPAATTAAGFACAAAVPLCAAVAIATVGAALYMTQDTWVPWIKGAFDSTVDQGATFGPSPGKLYTTLHGVGGAGLGVPNVAIYPEVWATFVGSANYGFVFQQVQWTTGDGRQLTWTGSWQSGFKTVGAGRASLNGNPWTPTSFYNSTYTMAGWHITSVTGAIYDLAVQWPTRVEAPIQTSVEVLCVNPDGSQYAVTSAVPLEGELVSMPTCTGKTGDLGGAHGKCATLSAGPVGGTLAVQSSNCQTVADSDLMYPDCVVSGCAYMVIVDGLPCTVGRPGCTDWARTYATSPGRVGCRYGEYSVRVSSCFFLERVYEASGDPVDGTLANTDGLPETFTGTAPAPSTAPQTYPNGAPGGEPGTLPGGGVGALPSPTGVPLTNADCWGSGAFSWNPVDWVVTPIKCGLAWAFVPRPEAVQTLADTAGADLAVSGIGPMVQAVNVNVTKVGSGGGCEGPSVTFAAVGITEAMHPFSACTAPMSTLAAMSYAMTTVVVVLGGGFVAIRAIGQGFGFNFAMGKGGGQV